MSAHVPSVLMEDPITQYMWVGYFQGPTNTFQSCEGFGLETQKLFVSTVLVAFPAAKYLTHGDSLFEFTGQRYCLSW